MKKLILVLILYIFAKIFINYAVILLYVNEITLLFIKNIFPSLFIFFIISSLLSNYGLIDYISKMFGNIVSKIFNISKTSSYVFIMSILSGFPSNSKYIKELLDKNLINNKEAEKVLLFTHFANPLFILSLIPYKAYLIIFCHYISNIIIGLIFRNYNGKFNSNISLYNKEKVNFINIFNNTIKETISIILNILGIIVCFYIVSKIFSISIITYFLEMTNSIYFLLKCSINIKYKLMLITGILSFGGFSVHMQVFSILGNKKIRYKPYFLARIIHFFISSILFFILY